MMGSSSPKIYSNVTKCVNDIIDNVGKEIVFGMPLALGKSYHIINELYDRAKNDPEISLTIITALSLEKPVWSGELEKRMLKPIVERIWSGVPDFDYMLDLRKNALPPNVTIREFFCKAGSYTKVPHAQQEYVSSNYTHVVRDLMISDINVYCHSIASMNKNGETLYSDSCNADMGHELISGLENKRVEGKKVVHIGHVNKSLPFMYGDAIVPSDKYDMILESEKLNFPLFSVPKAPVSTQDYMIGLNVSTLIKDGGTLQIGIGTLGDAIASGLIIRHRHNHIFKRLIRDTGIDKNFGNIINNVGGMNPFDEGLYGATEMLVEIFMELYREGIIKRKVYGNEAIQRLINQGDLKEILSYRSVDKLLSEEPFFPILTEENFNILKNYGILSEDSTYTHYHIVKDNTYWSCDLRDSGNKKALIENCIGEVLKNGVILHGGFFIGSNSFYEELREMDEEERKQFEMTGVNIVNHLYGDEKLRALQRKNARFVNAGMIISLLGNVCSDGLENGTVISGVGGQYNFVSMAHALPDGRLIMMIRSTKKKGAETISNIVFNYGHTTVPRHLRDIVVTEYGIADLLGKPDKEVIAELLNITDSRFQDELLEKAKRAKKIPKDYVIPEKFRNNYPQQLESVLKPYREDGFFKSFPFGSDFTEEEIVIGKALKNFKQDLNANKFNTIKGFLGHLVQKTPSAANPYIERMDLSKPSNIKDKLMKQVLTYALKSSGEI